MKIRNWDNKTSKNSIAAVSGTPSAFTPFSVDEATVLGNNPYLVESPNLHSSVKTICVGKYLKEKKKELVGIIPVYTEAKNKNIHFVSFPAVLLFLRSHSFAEGQITDDAFTEPFIDTHELYQDWLQLKVDEFAVEEEFLRPSKIAHCRMTPHHSSTTIISLSKSSSAGTDPQI